MSRINALLTECVNLMASLKEYPGGSNNLHTVQAQDIPEKARSRAQRYGDMMDKHKKSIPRDFRDIIMEAGDIQAALMIDRVPRMMAEYCSFYDSARAELLAIETAFLADANAVQEIKDGLIVQVILIPTVCILLLYCFHVMLPSA